MKVPDSLFVVDRLGVKKEGHPEIRKGLFREAPTGAGRKGCTDLDKRPHQGLVDNPLLGGCGDLKPSNCTSLLHFYRKYKPLSHHWLADTGRIWLEAP